MEKRAGEMADKPSFYYYDDTYTYGSFNTTVNKFANALTRLGIRRGDIVSVLSWNSPEVLISYFAAQKIGAAAGPIVAEFKGDEIAYVLNNSEAKAVVVEEDLLPTLEGIKGKLSFLKHIVVIGSRATNGPYPVFTELVAGASEENPGARVEPGDMAYLFYTAGTTGFPMGVPLTHKNIMSYYANGGGLLGGGGSLAGANIVFLVILPLFHVNAMMTCIGSLNSGVTVCLRKRFSAREFWGVIERYRVNVMSAVPAVYNILLKDDADYTAHDRSSFFLGITGAAAISPETIRRFEEKFGISVIEGYGLTEGTVASTMNPVGERKIGSVGKPLPGQEIRIVDDRGAEIPAGRSGEIVIRGENVMAGYYQNPEATKEVLKDGWLHTGDIGYKDVEGYIFIVDRKKDMLIRGGENIYPKEIEHILYEHSKVVEAAVVGIPDEVMGEEVVAFLTLKPGAAAGANEIQDYLRTRLAEFKVPRHIAFIDEMPRNPVGKILKKVLRERAKSLVPSAAAADAPKSPAAPKTPRARRAWNNK